MTIQETLDWITKNAKKWTIDEQSSNKLVISKGDVVITIINNEISWKNNMYESKLPIEVSEISLKVLTSRDWIPQTYCRSFGYIARTKNPDDDIWPEDFVDYFEDIDTYSFVTSIKYKAKQNEYKGGGTIFAKTVCSLDKTTLETLNKEVDNQLSDGVGESVDLVNICSDGYFYKT